MSAPAKPIATSRLVVGGVLVAGIVSWMAWQRLSRIAGEPLANGDDYYRSVSGISIAPLTRTNGGVTIGALVPVTNDERQSSSPAFTLDSKSILFSSTRDDGDRTEIYRYDVETKQTARLTDTREFENAAAPLPDGARFAALRVAAEYQRVGVGRRIGMISSEELWTFALDGSGARRLFDKAGTIAAQHWLDSTTVALIAINRSNALILRDVRTAKADTLLRNLGSGAIGYLPLVWSPTRNALLVARNVDSSLMLSEVNPRSRAVRDLMKLPADVSSFVEIDGALVASVKARLMCWQPTAQSWIDVGDLGTGTIMKLAASPDGQWVALAIYAGDRPPRPDEAFQSFVRSPTATDAPRSVQVPHACVGSG
jgi:dipeptidyl aminopeptidase/acylaminoacyl peptidase